MEALSAIAAHDEVPGVFAPAAPAGAGSADLPFARLVSEGLHAVDAQLKTSQTDLQQLALGEALNLHEVMIRLEESRIAFQLMLQVRNRVLEAYQDVMKMQV
ncbi:flagellar hook-basal body complex protein FliE [Ramlibacter sp. XY19]|uniref:flagellar hook-basal body complex protein FliE n=1 Tax=Ramlibacter paludis TaxID=2908000 RepID=UPI0023D9BFA4|nr:flagellar hook-basal body complex protein FliE [Ramlibacter paludis]MCG2594949.1 flagellar hook-basal body complex protein FliE [Ramlibacter paludis]